MPARILRDGILRSERVDRLSMGAELFFRRLMSVVDDYGRYEARAKLLKVDCFPLRDGIAVEEVEGWLAECVAADGLVLVYEVGGKKYLQLSDFGQRTRSQSRFPAPPNTANCRDSRADDGSSLSLVGTSPSFTGQARTDDGHMSAECGQMTGTCPPLRAGAIGVGVVCEAEGVVGGGARAEASAAPNERPPQPSVSQFEPLILELLARHPAKGSLPLCLLRVEEQFARHGGGDPEVFCQRLLHSHSLQAAGWNRRTRPVRCPELQYWLSDETWRATISRPVSASVVAAPAACNTCGGKQFVLREDGAGIHCPACGGFGRNTVAFEAHEERGLAKTLLPAPVNAKQAVAV